MKSKPGPKPTPVDERFRRHFAIGDHNECWEWQAARMKSGYGVFDVKADNVHLAHRYQYERTYGPIPEGLEVAHTCDNPPCVNPVHLYVATHKENMADIVKRDRQCKGELNGSSVLTEGQVAEIRLLVASGVKQNKVAKMYSIGCPQISRIVNGREWKHLK